MNTVRSLVLGALGLLLGGCATMINGPRQEVAFKTTPPGATVKSDGEELCTTPCTAKLSRRSDHVITLELPGHYPYRMIMRNRGSNLIAIYALMPNPLFLAVDLISGSAWFLTPEGGIDRTLDPLEDAPADPGEKPRSAEANAPPQQAPPN